MSTFEKTTNTTIPFHNNISHKRRAKTPSFSSVLLDAIYHSIDDTETDTNSSSSQHNCTLKTARSTSPTINTNIQNILDVNVNVNAIDCDYLQSTKQKRNKMRSNNNSSLETIDLRHAIMIDSWIENQPPQPQPQPKVYYNNRHPKSISYKSSKRASSSTSSSSSSSSSSSCFTQEKIESCLRLNHTRKHETSSKIFNKTKLKALKIYSDLKKSKQQRQQEQMPVSPGERIAAFFNSIFKNSDDNQSKTKMPMTNPTSECSSASSVTRSCLSKTTRSTEKSNRSVRFYPVNTVIFDDEDPSTCYNESTRTKRNQPDVDHQKLLDLSKAAFDHEQHRTMLIDEDSTTCNNKLIPRKHNQVNVDDQKLLDSLKVAFDHQQQRRPMLIDIDTRTCNKKLIRNANDQKLDDSSKRGFHYEEQCRKLKRDKEIDVLMMMVKKNCRKSDDDYEEVLNIEMSLDEEFMNVDDDDNDDGESCDSSDLFELENFSSIGVGAFNQELPVFGTTSLKNITV